jgi:hypothetical protein
MIYTDIRLSEEQTANNIIEKLLVTKKDLNILLLYTVKKKQIYNSIQYITANNYKNRNQLKTKFAIFQS